MADSVTPSHRMTWSSLAVNSREAQVGILGVPFDGAVSYRKGAALAPSSIREITPYVPPFTEEGRNLTGLTLCDYGDVLPDLDWERYFATVEDRALQVLSHPFGLFLGGDHSVSIPLIRAFSRATDAPFGVLHIDAHTDLMNTYDGHAWSHACTERRVLELPNIEPRHLVFVGIRSWLQEELDYLAANPAIGVHTARSVYRRGIETIARDVVAQLEDIARVYITLDIDNLDPAYAPGTGTPEAGGLTSRDLLELLRIVFSSLPVRALDIVEVAPPLDHAGITSMAAVKIIYEVFGWLRRDA